ncbi:response regulator receiver protein [Maricaulis sp.]|uniref:response regulator receiver protein n=1 Tax=Maricaulis sp. TaxID=1486257 RepID=UPI003A8F6A2F
MSEVDYARASVLLFDPVHVNQRTSRYALFEMGFRNIECVSNLNEFKGALADTSPALVVAESSATDADVFALVRSVRRSDLGRNPFVVILLTTWSRDTTHIRRAIECGADDVIVRPFSTMFAAERVRTLVRDRKDFIVTSDYVGPDRRKSTDRDSDTQPLTVPNFLQAIVHGDDAAIDRASSWAREAKDVIIAERLRRMAMRIVISVEIQLNKPEKNALPVRLDVADMARTARELRVQLVKASRGEAAEVAAALIDQISSLGDGSKADKRSLQLIKELSMATYAAFANGESLERSKDEIDRTVANLRARLQTRSADGKLRAQIEAARAKAVSEAQDTADDTGQADSAGIKRAAM